MRYREFLFVRETSLLLFTGLVLVNHSVLGVHVLWSIRRRGLLLSFYLERGSGCEDVLSEIVLLDNIFKVTEGSTLRSHVSLVVIEGAVVLRSGTSRVVLFCF